LFNVHVFLSFKNGEFKLSFVLVFFLGPTIPEGVVPTTEADGGSGDDEK